MKKLGLIPDQASYSTKDGTEVLSAQFEGGPPRYRRDVLGASSRVTVSWTLDASAYQYLRTFHRTAIGKGADWFLIDLLLDDADLAEYQAHFVPGSFGLQSRQGRAFVAGAELDVIPNATDQDYDDAVLMLFDEYGWGRGGTERLFELLSELVNQDLPG
jgi:hypothetical protein